MECPACGSPIPEGAKFCPECGARVATPDPMGEQRQTVTVLFSDVTGSTMLGERLDAESMRRVLARFFDLAREVIENHGGTVEKFIGDAVMAIFGVPMLHEDDALRAVRAASELHRKLVSLNDELSRSHGVSLELRTGVNTGEVVTGTQERLATGDAINVAARLQQLASPGEILIGESVVRLVRDAASVEAVGPVDLRGKSAPVGVFRLAGVGDGRPSIERRHTAPLVGRDHELHLLSDAYARVVREESCGLFSLLGAAGVGKSRLAEEFVATLDSTVLRGRCLSYGEGITYWPVVQVVKALLRTDPSVAALLTEAREIEAGVAALFGEADAATSSNEIAWAVRKILERAASIRPLVVVLDDLHWGEPTLFDLIEHVTDLSRSAPIFLLCVARPELVDRRPGWGGGKLNATTILLEPLNDEETDKLIDVFVGQGEKPGSELRARVRGAAGGNPLFVEEMLTLAADAHGSEIKVPPTIQALLSARLDQLALSERRVLERGAVEGQSLHVGAVTALAPDVTEVPSHLVGLVRKDLIRPDRATLPGDDAFRFRHLLIRDAAYDGLAKSVRADLHARFASWLADAAPELVELDEIVGYHLEQAVRYRAELGPLDDATRAFAAAASARLEFSGARALDRGDLPAALNLLDRAAALSQEGDVGALDLLIAQALASSGQIESGIDRALVAADRARLRGDRVSELEARLWATGWSLNTDPERAVIELPPLIEQARDELADSSNDAALAYLWFAVAGLDHYFCRFGSGFEASVKTIRHAEAAGLRSMARNGRISAVAELKLGPTPLHEAVDWIESLQASIPFYEPWPDQAMASLLALAGRHEEARALADRSAAAVVERGEETSVALFHMNRWDVEMAAGDNERALREAIAACEAFEQMGERSWLSTAACMLAESLYVLGRCDEAGDWARKGLELGASDDIATQSGAAQILGKLAARRGQRDEALALGERGLALVEPTEAPVHRGEALLDLAEIHHLLGDDRKARSYVDAAVAQFASRGATALIDNARRRFADLGGVAQ